MNRAGPIITVAIALVLIVAIASRFGATTSSWGAKAVTGPGFPAPTAGGTTLSGQRWNLQDQRGKVVLLDFWATWCPACVTAQPEIKQVHEKLKANADFVLVGVSLDYTKPPLEAFLSKNRIDWLQIFDRDSGAELAHKFGVSAIPATFLIDRGGNAHSVELGPDEMIAEIEKLLKAER